MDGYFILSKIARVTLFMKKTLPNNKYQINFLIESTTIHF